MGADVGLLLAFGGGLVSFLSPCVLPLVPAYLSIVTGLAPGELRGEDRPLGQIFRTTGGFVAGFSVVFIALGLSATTLGSTLLRNQSLITRLSGLVVLGMALFLLGSLVLRAPWLYQERRFHPHLARFGPFAPPIAGLAFGFGWTPCIGPVLTSVLAVAATRGRASEGAALLAAYSAGLAVPFLATGLAFDRLTGAFALVKRHITGLTATSGATLAIFGLLLSLDRMAWATARLQDALRAAGLERLVELG
jgi:cytochrome c-type biogenesis protein